MNRTGRRILILRYRFIGDTILTVPFLRNLRRAEPDAYIAWVVAPGSSEVVQGIPYVDELIYWDPPTIHADSRGAHRTWGAKIEFIRQLRAKRFDKVYVLKRSLSSAIMAFLTGAPRRIGFDTEGRGPLLTTRVPYRNDRHEVENFLEVLRADGVDVRDNFLEAWVSSGEADAADKLLFTEGLRAGTFLLAIHPLASSTGKSWPIENFAAVACRLNEMFGLVPVVLGGEKDVTVFGESRHLFPSSTIDLVGKCSLRVTMAVLKRCHYFVGNDSGLMHMAAAAGVPLLAILGSTSPVRFGPWGLESQVIWSKFPCAPCRQKFFEECKPSPRMRPACLEAIEIDAVLERCIEALRSMKA